MAKVVKVCVVDDKGNGLSGQIVKTYNGAQTKTDKSDYVSLVIDGSQARIYVNGREAFDGAASRLRPLEVFTKGGARP